MRDAARMPRTPTTEVARTRPRTPGPIAVALLLTGGALGCLRLPVLPPAWSLGCVALAIAALVLAPRCRQPPFRIPARCIAIVFAGAWLAGINAHLALAPPAHTFAGSDTRIAGRIVDLPVIEPRRVRFHLRVDDAPGQPETLRGRVVRLAWYDARDAAPAPRPAAGS